MTRLVRILGFSAIAFSLTACGGTDPEDKKVEEKETGGLNIARLIGAQKNPPDEFAVIATAPLQMPEDFAALPPPNPGQRSALAPDPISEARTVLFGDAAAPQAANARVSVSESALLSASGSSDPNIRTVLAEEQAELDDGQGAYFLDGVFPALRRWRGEDDKDAIKPAEERVRLSTAGSGPRQGGAGIATIPSGPSAPVAPLPTAARPSVPVPAVPAARPTVDPVTGGELIYIPE